MIILISLINKKSKNEFDPFPSETIVTIPSETIVTIPSETIVNIPSETIVTIPSDTTEKTYYISDTVIETSYITDKPKVECDIGYFIPDDDKTFEDCQKCSLEGCKKCNGTYIKIMNVLLVPII